MEIADEVDDFGADDGGFEDLDAVVATAILWKFSINITQKQFWTTWKK